MKPTLQSISDTGTDFGYSSWTKWLGCGRKALLDLENPRSPGLSGKEAIDVGVVTHALLENWYRLVLEKGGEAADAMDTRLIKWTDPAETPANYQEKVYQEADRLFQSYRRHHDPEEFGVPFSIEELYTVHNFYHWTTFTIRPDLVVKLTDSRAAKMGLPGGGVYTIDFKTWGRRGAFDELYSRTDLRFHCYMEAFARANPGERYLGNLIFAIYRGREVEFARYFLPYSDYQEDRVRALTFSSKTRKEWAKAGNTAVVDNQHCVHFTRWEKCKYLFNGCKGY